MKKELVIGIPILVISWIIAIPGLIWVSNARSPLDHIFMIVITLFILIGGTLALPLLFLRKHYQKKMNIVSKDSLVKKKIDRKTILFSLIAPIILTILILSTYSYSKGGVETNGIGWHIIEGLFDESRREMLLGLYIMATILFCFEFIISYFIVDTLRLWRKK
jgi:hypothetical protein